MKIRLMAAAEIARALDVSASRAHAVIRDSPDFPEPVDELKVGKIYLADDVEEWIRKRDERRRAARS